MRRRLAQLAGPAVLLGVGALMASWTWLAWTDVVVDFGREVFVPWQLSEGKTLYADLWYFNGPLSPYVNSLLFRIFGVGIHTLIAANLVLLTLVTGLLYALLRAASDRLSATVACAIFLLLFAFGNLSERGNYNFVTPYSHEATHGLLLALLGVACVFAYARRPRRGTLLLAGASLGLVFLTKAEVFLAAAVSILGGFVLAWWQERPAPGALAGSVGALLGAALVPPLVAGLLLASAMPPADALRGTLGTWSSLFSGAVSSSAFYQVGMGSDQIGLNLARMLVWSAGILVLLAPGLAVALALGRERGHGQEVALALFLLMAGLLSVFSHRIPWFQVPRPLPLFVALLALWATLRLQRGEAEGDREGNARSLLRVVLLLLAGTLLAKIALNARIYHYGFVLAMPATLALVVAGVGWIPEALNRRGRHGAAFRGAVLGILAATVAAHLVAVDQSVRARTHLLGSGGDALRVRPFVGSVLNEVLADLEERLSPRASFAALPEGVMLNYLTRHPTPTRHVNFSPFDLRLAGEERVARELADHPPEFVLLVHRETPEHGFRVFGKDYARSLHGWLSSGYRPVRRFGGEPFHPETQFGVVIMERIGAPGEGQGVRR